MFFGNRYSTQNFSSYNECMHNKLYCIGAEIIKQEIKRIDSYMKYGTGVATKRRRRQLSDAKLDALAKARSKRWIKVCKTM